MFLADCLSSKETLAKYRIGFIYYVAEYLKTLEYIKTLKAKAFVPAHAPAADDISELADLNINVVNEIAKKLRKYANIRFALKISYSGYSMITD